MHKVKPATYLVAYPQMDWSEVIRYLDSVGGESWVHRTRGEIPDGEALIEFGGRACYRSWEPGLNKNVTRIREDHAKYFANILKSGHGSVIEHANYSFVLADVSRVLTHEIVRHRAGVAISQESLRYVRLDDLGFWFPEWVELDERLMTMLDAHLNGVEYLQKWMADHFGLDDPDVDFAEKKAKTSFMRRFAPQGMATMLLMTVNVRALRHIIYMRSALGAEEEIRIVADQMADLALDAVPNLMQDYQCTDDLEWIPDWVKV